MIQNITHHIADELAVSQKQVMAAINLLDEGATVPFIARYRKEATNGLDDSQLRLLETRLSYLRELEDRREVILKSIQDQDKLSPELKQKILAVTTKTELEDLYLPFKPKRRTKAQIAREAGLEPLAEKLFSDPSLDPEMIAKEFFNEEHEIKDTKTALNGARQILMEDFSEDASLLSKIRNHLKEHAIIKSSIIKGQEKNGSKFADYFDYAEALNKIPSHRALAIFRGRNEGFLQLQLLASSTLLEEPKSFDPCQHMIAQHHDIQHQNRPADDWLQSVVEWTWRVKLHHHFETELLGFLREKAEADAIQVFAKNLRDLLMAAPAGPKVTMGLDPGLRTGVKVVVVDDTGKLLTHTAIFPHVPQNQWQQSLRKLKTIVEMHKVNLISIGNGTGSRETDRLIAELQKENPELKLERVVVSEAGASVYSASELASEEFPDLDVSLRGAVSIARRIQDPLAELVKIDPKSIGVGQYQHDVNQSQLSKMLGNVIEDCVNAVGVDLNTASVPLLSRVSGLNKTLAKNIVKYRDLNGRFNNRQALLDIERLGPKTFEQAAGFLRIMEGDNPLDSSAVHPEAYPVVENILHQLNKEIKDLIGDTTSLKQLSPESYTNEKFGLPTVTDIIKELDKPGRDPRPEFKMARFKEGIETIADLEIGMKLEGVVTNVTDFGAFVDVGVHQDGLVHISLLADRFVKDPREVVKTGDLVKVHVVDLDIARKRINLSMRMNDKAAVQKRKQPKQKNNNYGVQQKAAPKKHQKEAPSALGMALADALKKAKN